MVVSRLKILVKSELNTVWNRKRKKLVKMRIQERFQHTTSKYLKKKRTSSLLSGVLSNQSFKIVLLAHASIAKALSCNVLELQRTVMHFFKVLKTCFHLEKNLFLKSHFLFGTTATTKKDLTNVSKWTLEFKLTEKSCCFHFRIDYTQVKLSILYKIF